MSTTETVALRGTPKGSARMLRTVLREKIEQAPWKEKSLRGIGRTVICLELIDRENDRTMVFKDRDGTLVVQSHEPEPHIVIKVPQEHLFALLKIPQGALKLPGLYKGAGREVVKLLLNRTVVVKGLLRHPLASLRILQVLAVPPDAK